MQCHRAGVPHLLSQGEELSTPLDLPGLDEIEGFLAAGDLLGVRALHLR